MARLRWGEDVPEDSDAARLRLLDAAEECFERFGVTKTTVEDVAERARVSRATVYRYFEGRDELILGYLIREADRFLARLQTQLTRQATLADSIVEGVVFTLDAVRKQPTLALLFAPDAVGVTGAIAGASDALFARTAEHLRPLLEGARAAGELRSDVDLDEASEWMLRTVLSLLVVAGPVRRSKARQRAFLHTFLVPALVSPTAGRRSGRR